VLQRNEAGVSVPELILFLAVLSVVIGLFVPAGMRKRILLNEAIAVGALKAIHSASAAFYTTTVPNRYPTTLNELTAGDGPYLDGSLASGLKAGYTFSVGAEHRAEAPTGFSAEAHPVWYRRQGVRSFYIDETGRLLAEDIGGFPGNASMQPMTPPQEETTR
jgi:hypothetical protein